VQYVGAEGDELRDGQIVFYRVDTSQSTQAEKFEEYVVETCQFNNVHRPAGIITKLGHATVDATGAHRLSILPIHYAPYVPGVKVWTEQNIAIGDILGPMPGSRSFWKYCGFGRSLFRSNEAADRSTTAGTVWGDYGYDIGRHPMDNADQAPRSVLYELGNNVATSMVGAAAGGAALSAGDWVCTVGAGGAGGNEQVGAGVYAAGDTSFGIQTDNGAGDHTQLQLRGAVCEPDKDCFAMYIKGLKIEDVSTSDFFAGWGTVVADITGTSPSDHIAFTQLNGGASNNVDLDYAKDGGAETSVDTGTDFADGTEVDLFFYFDVDNSAIYCWVDGAQVTNSNLTTLVTADLPAAGDDLAPSIGLDAIGGATEKCAFHYAVWGVHHTGA
jgi:hypothetical protein